MAGLYVDTSALGRVMLAEPGAQLIRDTMAQYEVLWSSALLAVELRRLARREGIEERAEELEPVGVRALDAIHLGAAIQLAKRGVIDAMLTFDQQLQGGCTYHGVAVEAPVTS